MNIQLVKEVYVTEINDYEKKLGELILKDKPKEFNRIKPILKSEILFKKFTFYISEITQDIMNDELIFYQKIWISRYKKEKELQEIINKYSKFGWKWVPA